MGNITSDQKLKLVQMIRNENQDNRLRMRSRERILYGGNAKFVPEDLPLYNKAGLSTYEKRDKELYALEEGAAQASAESTGSSFKFRLVIAVILFAAFLILDAGGGTVAGMSASKLQEEINKDFDLGLSTISFDFENNFPYTLFGK